MVFGVHDDAPAFDEYPVSHGVADDEFAGQYEPAGHVFNPLLSVQFAVGSLSQRGLPDCVTPGQYEPAGHG